MSTAMNSYFNTNNNSKNSVISIRSQKNIFKTETSKTILIARPDVIKFFNCESKKIYKETIIIRNIDTQIARFKVETKPVKSAFNIFFKSGEKGNKRNIAPGMGIRLVVYYKCDGLTEPEETILLHVRNGKSVILKIRTFRDPPILRALFLSSFKCVTSSSNLELKDSLSIQTKSYSNTSLSKKSINSNDFYRSNLHQLNINCNKCFVGEFIIVSTILINIGGKGRFFIMSEFDWCSMQIEDLTVNNKLIVSPFALWPSYFILDSNEQLTLFTYFYPDSFGLQTDQLYIITDNCSIKTIEVFGDGVLFEPHFLQFDKQIIKYQWYRTKSNEYITIRYLDLGFGSYNDVLNATFTVTSTCELELHYRWVINNNQVYPTEYTNLFARKEFLLDQINIKPNYGTIQPNSITIFKVLVCLINIIPGQYRSNLQLIIEDLPFAAISKKHDFIYEESKSKHRLCDKPIDLLFQSIEVRIKCTLESNAKIHYNINNRTEYTTEDALLYASTSTVTDLQENTFFFSKIIPNDSETNSFYSISNNICQFLHGYGICNCCITSSANTGVIRPGSPVYIGIETEFHVVLRNQSFKKLTYWWGNILGRDRHKVKIKFEQKYNFILPYSSEIVKLTLLPLETGNVSSIYMTCHFNNISPLVLSIECTIQSLCILLYFPSIFENEIPLFNQFHMEWNANEYVSKYDVKTRQIKLLQEKISKEKFIYSTILNSNSNDSLEKINFESNSSHKIYDGEKKTSSYGTSILDNISENNWEVEESPHDISNQNLILLPYSNFQSDFIKQYFHYLPLVVEIHIDSDKSATKRIYLQNETPIVSNFCISIKNFFNKTKLEDNNENEFFSGVILNIVPERGKIKPKDLIYFDIIATSNTWGIYTDRITIKIDLLPPHSFWIRIINNNLPISYPIFKNSLATIPKIRFNIFKLGSISTKRRLLIKNTSIIPVYLYWHCFSVDKDVETKPFNVILDMFSPFFNINELLLTNKMFLKEIKRYFSCALNPALSKENLIESKRSNDENSIDTSSNNYCVFEDNQEKNIKNDDTKSSLTKNSNKFSIKSTSSSDITFNKIKDSELQLSLIPYYGELINDLFIIKPKELFLPPKEKRYVYFYINTEKLKSYTKKIKLYKACGFIRIPPIFKFNDNMFLRKDGYYLPPTEVYLECDFMKPTFLVYSCKSQRTFEFHLKDFLQYKKSKLKTDKKILFKNPTEETIFVDFEINEPFQIIHVSTQREIFYGKSGFFCPGENAEIELECIVDKKWIENEIKWNDNSLSTYTVVKKTLSIIYREGFTQSVAVYIKICFPSLKLSKNYLNFGEILIGHNKTLMFDIQNLSDRPQYYEIKRNDKNNIFSFYPSKTLLSTRAVTNTNLSQILVCFTSKNPGTFKETVEIISEIDGLVFNCVLEGSVSVQKNI